MATFRSLLNIDSSAAGVVGATRVCSACWGPLNAAIPLLTQAIRLNPRSPSVRVLQVTLGRMLLSVGQDAEAITWFERSLQEPVLPLTPAPETELPLPDPRLTAQYLLASAYGLTDRLDDAHRMLASALQHPSEMDMTVRSQLRFRITRFADPVTAQRERRIADGLRRAGLRDHLDEEADSGLPPDATMRDATRVDGPTPMSVPGATTIRTAELQRILEEDKPLLLTTADPQYNPTIPGAVRIGVVSGGSLSDEWQSTVQRIVEGLIGEHSTRPIVVFGYSINHWDARNLALRLVALGYRHVYWYRGGWEAWDAHDLPKGPLTLEAH